TYSCVASRTPVQSGSMRTSSRSNNWVPVSMLILTGCLMLVLVLKSCTDSGKTFSWHVVNADTGRPVVGARVFIGAESKEMQYIDHVPGEGRVCVTDQDGQARCPVKYSRLVNLIINA